MDHSAKEFEQKTIPLRKKVLSHLNRLMRGKRYGGNDAEDILQEAYSNIRCQSALWALLRLEAG